VLRPRISTVCSCPPSRTFARSATLPGARWPSAPRIGSVVPGRVMSSAKATNRAASPAVTHRRAQSATRCQPGASARTARSRRDSPAPVAAPTIIGTSCTSAWKPRPRTRTSIPNVVETSGRSTVGPTTSMRPTSQARAKTSGASRIAQRDRSRKPDKPPTAKPTAIAAITPPGVIGPRGMVAAVSQPASALTPTAIAAPTHRLSRTVATAARNDRVSPEASAASTGVCKSLASRLPPEATTPTSGWAMSCLDGLL
jgi:hypothetical protein